MTLLMGIEGAGNESGANKSCSTETDIDISREILGHDRTNPACAFTYQQVAYP